MSSPPAANADHLNKIREEAERKEAERTQKQAVKQTVSSSGLLDEMRNGVHNITRHVHTRVHTTLCELRVIQKKGSENMEAQKQKASVKETAQSSYRRGPQFLLFEKHVFCKSPFHICVLI